MVVYVAFFNKTSYFAHKFHNMGTNIVGTIQSRLELMGMSQAQFAECVSATPAQMSIFLKEKGTLSIESLNKSLDLVGINLSIYSKRNDLAKEIASILLSKNVTLIDNWTKSDLYLFTQIQSISLLFDVKDEKEYIEIERSGIIDIESTFPYFKALVSYYMSLNCQKPTASKAKQALTSIMSNTNLIEPSKTFEKNAIGAAVGAVACATPILGAVLAAANIATNKQVGAFSLFAKTLHNSLFAKGVNFFK